MLKQSRFILIMGTILILIGLSFVRINETTATEAYARKGIVTLTGSMGQSRIKLMGEWQVFPNTLAARITDSTPYQWIDGEHLWNVVDGQDLKGVATYRVTLRGLVPSQVYALTTQDQAGAYRVRVNGVEVMGNGVVTNDPDTYVSDVKTVVGFFSADASGRAVLTVEIANFTRWTGGLWHAFELGTPDVIVRHHTTVIGFEVLVFAVMLSIGLLFLLFSSIRKEVTAFYTSLFALIMALRVVSTGTHIINQAVEGLPLLVVLKLEYWSGYILIPVLAMILESLDYVKPNRWRRRLIIGYAGLVSAFILFASDTWLEWSYPINQGMIVVFAMYAVVLLIQGVRKRDVSVGYLWIGSLALLAGTYAELNLKSVSYALFFASFTFVLSVAVSVVIRFGGLKAAKETLEKDVFTDYLTGLGNRAYLYHVLDQLRLSTSSDLHYLIFIDADDFKVINDTYGHEVGDEVLKEIALRIKATVRDHDHVVRFAGDEFIVVVMLNPQYGIEVVIERLNQRFRDPIVVKNLPINLTMSIGSTLIDLQETDPDRIISLADRRMYEEKTRHKSERMR